MSIPVICVIFKTLCGKQNCRDCTWLDVHVYVPVQ